MKHELKILPEWYNALVSGIKPFEIRKDDRNPKFAVGDELFMREFDGEKYTGRTVTVLVKLIVREEYCKDGYCIMSVELLDFYPRGKMDGDGKMNRLTLKRNSDGSVSQPTNLDWHAVLDKLTNYEDEEEQKEKGCELCNKPLKWEAFFDAPYGHLRAAKQFCKPGIIRAAACPRCGRKLGD